MKKEYVVVKMNFQELDPNRIPDEIIEKFGSDEWATYVEYDASEAVYKAYYEGSVPTKVANNFATYSIENVSGELCLTGNHFEGTPTDITYNPEILIEVYNNIKEWCDTAYSLYLTNPNNHSDPDKKVMIKILSDVQNSSKFKKLTKVGKLELLNKFYELLTN